MSDLPPIEVPSDINYVGVFLSFNCNINCSYCINDPEQAGGRKAMAGGKDDELPPADWVRGLSRLHLGGDTPITLQGGEPTLYHRGRGLGEVMAGLDHPFDLLTNLGLPPERMGLCLGGQTAKLRRDAPYPSIRVSYHPVEMDRVWGDGIGELVRRCEALRDLGFAVGPVKAETDVGIYMVAHPDNLAFLDRARAATAGRVHFETKEFLGVHDGALFGTYRYPYSINLVSSGLWDEGLSCRCRTTEILIDPLGFVWGCHYHLYDAWMGRKPLGLFQRLQQDGWRLGTPFPGGPVGHILDPAFTVADIRVFRPCHDYGRCIGCDTKVKNDRFQSLYDQSRPHTSVEIADIRVPAALAAKLSAAEIAAIDATHTGAPLTGPTEAAP